MSKLSERISWINLYFKRFGLHGILFLFKRYISKKKTIIFSHAQYCYPIFLRNYTSDILTFHDVILNQQYDILYGFEPKVIIDCGANIGLATVYFKNRFPDAKIISIEPEQTNFDLLLKNTREYNDIYCLKCGLWNKPSNLLINDSGSGNWGFMVEESVNDGLGLVSAVTINEIMKKFNIDCIDILKIDIEGSEKEVFESNFDEWLPKTKLLFIELHDKKRKGASKSFFKALVNYNFSMTNKGDMNICFIE